MLAEKYLGRVGSPRGDLYHVAFRVDPESLDSLSESLRAKGIDVAGPIDFATGRRSYFFEDLDQHYLELTDR